MIYCTAALTSFSNIITYITFLFSESRIAYILSKAWTNFDFETKAVEIRWKSSDIYYLEVVHSKFYKLDFVDFEVVRSWNTKCPSIYMKSSMCYQHK